MKLKHIVITAVVISLFVVATFTSCLLVLRTVSMPGRYTVARIPDIGTDECVVLDSLTGRVYDLWSIRFRWRATRKW